MIRARAISLSICSVAAASALFAAYSIAAEAEWPTFRGPERTGVSTETGLMTEWPEDGPPLLWQSKGAGRGYSSICIAGGKLYTLGDGVSTADEGDKDEYLCCFDEKDGKPIWKTKVGKAWNEGQRDWQSSRSTPTCGDGLVAVISAQGTLLVCDAATGEEKWRKDLKKEFDGKKADGWGYSESPTFDGDLLVCTPGGEKATMVAMKKATGEVVWTCPREKDRGAGHASIVTTKIGDTKVYVNSTGSGGMGVRASDGKLLWTFDIDRTTAVIPTLLVRDDLVYFVAGYNRGAALLKQVPEGDEIKIEVVYDLKPPLANKHGGVVLVGDHVYGDSDDRGIPQCIDLMTGEVKWKERGSGRGSAVVTAADGFLYVRFQNGVLALAEATPDGYEEVGHFQIPESKDRPSWSHPVVLGGKLYIREQDNLYCYDVRRK
jgi:outer membrane protein assembly factor BamB